jgi:plasmid stabilization system protein ParE
VGRLVSATERLATFPESGRAVPEVPRADFREVIHAPYRIVYRLVGSDQIHVITVHHGARSFPQLV